MVQKCNAVVVEYAGEFRQVCVNDVLLNVDERVERECEVDHCVIDGGHTHPIIDMEGQPSVSPKAAATRLYTLEREVDAHEFVTVTT